MTDEELINSYDPDNEENNYHLPHHLYKNLQLKHFRQVCSEVVPNEVFISSYQVASNLESLQRHQITHIVNTAADVCDSCFPEHFKYTTYYLKDTNNEDISLLFYRTFEWMQSALEGGGRVLVHCREGVSRSATMIIAYLMWRFRLSFEAAHERIRKVRPICNPNTGFTCQLLHLGKKLGTAATPAGACPGRPADRPLERPALFRVAPHHPKEPFLLLMPAERSASSPTLDPRFGWVLVQRAGPASGGEAQITLWLGSQVVDAEVVQQAVRDHARRLEAFERCGCTVTVVSEGDEPPQLLEALGLPGEEAERGALAAPRSAFDPDFEVLVALASAGGGCESQGEEVSAGSPESMAATLLAHGDAVAAT